MTFDEALRKMRDHGFRITRAGWNGKGMSLGIILATGTRRAYIEMHTAQGDYVPWVASQSDLLAEDWTTL